VRSTADDPGNIRALFQDHSIKVLGFEQSLDSGSLFALFKGSAHGANLREK
jgi:hypothetical protein